MERRRFRASANQPKATTSSPTYSPKKTSNPLPSSQNLDDLRFGGPIGKGPTSKVKSTVRQSQMFPRFGYCCVMDRLSEPGALRVGVLRISDTFRTLLQDVSNMFQQIEAGAKWPSQLLVGHVHCLEKHPHAVQAGDYRPVVLYSTLYRLWGCIHSRSLLAQLEAYILYATHGYLAGRQSSDITYWLQCGIEMAVKANEALCGVTTDIRRCFNYLPRWPLLIAAQCLGLPSSTRKGWACFLDHNVRTFCVRQQFGPMHHSTSGVPEGDSLSCVGMLMATCIHGSLLATGSCHEFCGQLGVWLICVRVLQPSPLGATLYSWSSVHPKLT